MAFSHIADQILFYRAHFYTATAKDSWDHFIISAFIGGMLFCNTRKKQHQRISNYTNINAGVTDSFKPIYFYQSETEITSD